MNRTVDVLLTALAPAIWGSTYFVTTTWLPPHYPLTVAMLRALPAGLLLLVLVRRLPQGHWWARSFVLGALNFSLFQAMLFVSAYRLPGGVAATVGAVQPLIVIGLSRWWLGLQVRALAVVAALVGLAGVAMLLLGPASALDPVGVAAGFVGAASMASGVVLSRRWQPPVPPLTFAAWQLSAGGLLLVPFAWLLEPPLPAPTPLNLLGFAYLGLVGAALTYMLWFRGVARLPPPLVSSLVFLSPVTAVLLGWILLGQSLTAVQFAGLLAALSGVLLSQRAQLALPARPAPAVVVGARR